MPKQYSFRIKDPFHSRFVAALTAEMNSGITVAAPVSPVAPTQADVEQKVRDLMKDYLLAYENRKAQQAITPMPVDTATV